MSSQLELNWLLGFCRSTVKGAELNVQNNPISSIYSSATLHWDHAHLTDADLQKKIENLDKFYQCSVLLINNNKLTQLPAFNKYPQFSNLKVISAFNNNLDKLPDLSKMTNLTIILLYGNEILNLPEFHGETICIDLAHNSLQSVTNLAKQKKLTSLCITNNAIVVLLGLPDSLQSIQLTGNPIHTLHKACFPSEEVYKLILEALTQEQIDGLQQPPPQIFRRGYHAVLQYYNQADVSQLSDNFKNKLTIIGEASAGKTSLIHTLMSGVTCLTSVDERTQVVDTYTWKLPDNCSYQVFDQGGQDIYTVSNRLFISKDSKNLICFNLNHGSTEIAAEMLRSTLQQFPNSEIHCVATQADLIANQDMRNDKMESFKQKMLSTLEQQITLLSAKTVPAPNAALIDSYEQRKKNMHFFTVSSQLRQGIPGLYTFLHELAKQNKQVVPQHWLKCYQLVSRVKTNVLTLDNFHKIYNNSLSFTSKLAKKISRTSSNEDSMLCLRYFSDCGHVIWFENHPILRNFVFHKLQHLINVIKSVLHHDIERHLKYDINISLQKVFYTDEYEKLIVNYKDQGLLSFQLMSYLWKEYELSTAKDEELLMLLQNLDICHEVVNHGTINDRTVFCPWFVSTKEKPDIIKEYTGGNTITLHLVCIFNQTVPNNITELMIVRLQRIAYQRNYLGERKAWRHGLYVSDDTLHEYILRSEESNSLHIYVGGQPADIINMWEDFEMLNDALKEILSNWHGILKSMYIPCSHCVMKENQDPKKRVQADVFYTQREKVYTDCSGESRVPAILVTKVNTEGDKREEHINAVKSYLTEIQHEKQTPKQESPHHEDVVTGAQQGSTTLYEGKMVQYALLADHKLTHSQTSYILNDLVPSICCIKIGGNAIGSGFVVGKSQNITTGHFHYFLLTNNHLGLQQAFLTVQTCEAEFGFYQLQQPSVVTVKIVPHLFASSTALYYVFVCLETSLVLDNFLSQRVHLGGLITRYKPRVNDPLVIIGHPQGTELKIDPSVSCVQTPTLHRSNSHLANSIFYQCSSFHGASGSPCFSVAQQKLCGLHSGGIINGIARHIGASSEVEYSIHLWDVISDIRQKIMGQTFQANVNNRLTVDELYLIFPHVRP